MIQPRFMPFVGLTSIALLGLAWHLGVTVRYPLFMLDLGTLCVILGTALAGLVLWSFRWCLDRGHMIIGGSIALFGAYHISAVGIIAGLAIALAGVIGSWRNGRSGNTSGVDSFHGQRAGSDERTVSGPGLSAVPVPGQGARVSSDARRRE